MERPGSEGVRYDGSYSTDIVLRVNSGLLVAFGIVLLPIAAAVHRRKGCADWWFMPYLLALATWRIGVGEAGLLSCDRHIVQLAMPAAANAVLHRTVVVLAIRKCA